MSDQDYTSDDKQYICFNPFSLGPLNQLSSHHWDKITQWLQLIETEATESLYQFQYGHVIGPFSTPNPGVVPDAHITSPTALDGEFSLSFNCVYTDQCRIHYTEGTSIPTYSKPSWANNVRNPIYIKYRPCLIFIAVCIMLVVGQSVGKYL